MIMTEDDTFRVLANRIPFIDMMKIYRSGKGPKPPAKPGEWDAFMLKYGWKWPEFVVHWKEWNGGMSTYHESERPTK